MGLMLSDGVNGFADMRVASVECDGQRDGNSCLDL